MRATFVDIRNELAEIEEEVAHLDRALKRIGSTAAKGNQETWEMTHVFASATEKIYTGCERVMVRVADEIDGDKVMGSEGWHATLLRRMAHPYPEVRPAIISPECHTLLDRLRAFRHRERNTYGFNLDHEIVAERSKEAIVAFRRFRGELLAFLEGRHA